jgi:Amt family ammonium transporter
VNPTGGDGLLAGNPMQLLLQLIAVVVTIALAAGVTGAVLGALRVLVGLRVPVTEEIAGIDIAEHGEQAYNGSLLGELDGRGASLGEGVLIAASELGRELRVASSEGR